MKFLTGLLMGAAATLLVATLIDYRWEPPTRLRASGPDVVETAAIEPVPLQANDRVRDFEPEPEPELIRSVTIAPLPALSDPGAEPAPAPVLASVPAPAPDPAPVPVPISEPLPGTESAPAAKLEAQVATAVIWKPFHSEVSAAGFARRLSTQLGYPFRAMREGPARYHVVFDYDTEQQRELLRSQVVALTGFEAI